MSESSRESMLPSNDLLYTEKQRKLLSLLRTNRFAVFYPSQLTTATRNGRFYLTRDVSDINHRYPNRRIVFRIKDGYSLTSNDNFIQVAETSREKQIESLLERVQVSGGELVVCRNRSLIRTPFRHFNHWQKLTPAELKILNTLLDKRDSVEYTELLSDDLSLGRLIGGEENSVSVSVQRLNAKLGKHDGERIIVCNRRTRQDSTKNPKDIVPKTSYYLKF